MQNFSAQGSQATSQQHTHTQKHTITLTHTHTYTQFYAWYINSFWGHTTPNILSGGWGRRRSLRSLHTQNIKWVMGLKGGWGW